MKVRQIWPTDEEILSSTRRWFYTSSYSMRSGNSTNYYHPKTFWDQNDTMARYKTIKVIEIDLLSKKKPDSYTQYYL